MERGKKKSKSADNFEVPTVSLHIHENIALDAIIRSIKREEPQIDLFAKPDMPLRFLNNHAKNK